MLIVHITVCRMQFIKKKKRRINKGKKCREALSEQERMTVDYIMYYHFYIVCDNTQLIILWIVD